MVWRYQIVVSERHVYKHLLNNIYLEHYYYNVNNGIKFSYFIIIIVDQGRNDIIIL